MDSPAMSVFTLRIYSITLKGLKGLGCHIGLKSETPANTKCKKHMKTKVCILVKSENRYCINVSKQRVEMSILISKTSQDKAFGQVYRKSLIRSEEVHQQDTIPKVNAPNNRVAKHIRQSRDIGYKKQTNPQDNYKAFFPCQVRINSVSQFDLTKRYFQNTLLDISHAFFSRT